MRACIVARLRRIRQEHWKPTMQRMDSSSHEGQRFGKFGISGCDWGIWKEEDSIIQIGLLYWDVS